MPPDDTIVAPAVISNASTTSRELATPRAAPEGARMSPVGAGDGAVLDVSATSRGGAARIVTRPCASPASTAAWNGATTPGPVPQVMWKRGTELPGPVADVAAALGPADDGKKPTPFSRSHARFSSCANCRYASAQRRGQSVLVAVEPGVAEPVLAGELERVRGCPSGAAPASR